jgi:hypothetical protein
MKSLALFTLLLVAFAVQPRADIKLQIGAKLDRKYIPKKITEVILTHPAQTRPFIERSIRGVKYIIAFDSQTREIKYINTTDPNFRTANDLRVDGKIPLTRDQLEVIPYWEVRAPMTPDGWYPVVGNDSDLFGYDLAGSFKENETRAVSIVGFSKGGN